MEYGDLTAGALEDGLGELLRQRLLKSYPLTSPAAGADFSVSVPAGVAWEVQTLVAKLVTSAVVANRVPRIAVTDGQNVVAQLPEFGNIAASQVLKVTYGIDVPVISQTDQAVSGAAPFYPRILPAGYVIQASTLNLDVGDQWSNLVLFVREWSLVSVTSAAEWFARKQVAA